MHFPKILAKRGCTNDRLREIFTSKCVEITKDMDDVEKKAAEKANENYDIRKKWEYRIWDRIIAGVQRNAQTSDIHQAIDMAWDGPPIVRNMKPLMMYAQGKIKGEELLSCLAARGVPADDVKKFVKKEKDTNRILLDIPRICETHINIVRSYIQRRHAAMEALWANLYPHWKYDPRGKSAVTQLMADVLTEKVDIICDQFGYRSQGTQWRRTMLMYAESFVFPKEAWTKKIGLRYEASNVPSDDGKIESYTLREGVDYVCPHPGRVYYDSSAAPRSVNTDTGVRWIGHWDIIPYGSLKDDQSRYYNVNEMFSSQDWNNTVGQFPDFFRYYFDGCVLNFPDCGKNDTRWNDRNQMVGAYAGNTKDQGVLVTQHFDKLNPKVENFGDYDAEIWVRFVVAGSGTIIGAEFMPSIPCCYGGINVNDNRLINQSMGSELLGLQDQMTNVVTNMLEALRASQIKLWLIDKDVLEEPIRKEIEQNAMNATWWQDPHVLIYSATKLKELGLQDPKAAVQLVMVDIRDAITHALQAMGQILNMADRLLILSPNELGQPNPREVAAREVQEISTSVQSIYSFINMGPREQTAALKELTYASLVTNGDPIVQVPVMHKYTHQTIKDAGFKVIDAPDDLGDNDQVDSQTPIEGPLSKLIYEYYFDSREGAERAVNTEGAKALTQMLQILLQTPGIPQVLGLDRLLDLVNSIIRMAGAPTDLQIERDDGENNNVPAPPQPQQQPQQAPQPQPAAQPQPQPNNDQLAQMAQQIEALKGVVTGILQQQGQGQPASGAPRIVRGVSAQSDAPPATRFQLAS